MGLWHSNPNEGTRLTVTITATLRLPDGCGQPEVKGVRDLCSGSFTETAHTCRDAPRIQRHRIFQIDCHVIRATLGTPARILAGLEPGQHEDRTNAGALRGHHVGLGVAHEITRREIKL